jgi:hypothetical protein
MGVKLGKWDACWTMKPREMDLVGAKNRDNCMVYINTLKLQQLLALPQWDQRLSTRDQSALTPLIWEHVNPYGRFELDMNSRLALQ